MALKKHWVLNDNFQPLFKIDFDAESSDYDYLWSLNGGIAYGGGNDLYPYNMATPLLARNATDPIRIDELKTRINSMVLGTYQEGQSRSVQDNQVVYKDSWDKYIYPIFTNGYVSRDKYMSDQDINFMMPYAVGEASKPSEGYFGYDFKIKNSEFYKIYNYIHSQALELLKHIQLNRYDFIYIGHIGNLYPLLYEYKNDFPDNVILIKTKDNLKDCIPISWWNCISNGATRCRQVNYTPGYFNGLNFYNGSVLYYNKNTGMCVFMFLQSSFLLPIQQDTFNDMRELLAKCADLQGQIGYITQ